MESIEATECAALELKFTNGQGSRAFLIPCRGDSDVASFVYVEFDRELESLIKKLRRLLKKGQSLGVSIFSVTSRWSRIYAMSYDHAYSLDGESYFGFDLVEVERIEESVLEEFNEVIDSGKLVVYENEFCFEFYGEYTSIMDSTEDCRFTSVIPQKRYKN